MKFSAIKKTISKSTVCNLKKFEKNTDNLCAIKTLTEDASKGFGFKAAVRRKVLGGAQGFFHHMKVSVFQNMYD